MSYFVVVPGALVPASIAQPLLARAKAPLLARRLRHAKASAPQVLAGDGAAHLDWLWSQFGAGAERPITAPYAWRALNLMSAIDVPSDQPIWQADPVHFALARDRMLVTRLDGEATVTPEESSALAAEAAPIVAGFNATLRVLDPSHWFLSFDTPWPLTTVSYDAALGRSAEHVLPEGNAAARWRRLLTEIQIAWHQHPVNERREAAGMRTINGVWLHGGGVWRELPRRPFEVIAASDATIRGWALASGVAPSSVTSGDAKPASVSSALTYCLDLHPFAIQEDWDGWLTALARFDANFEGHFAHAFANGFGDVTLVLAGREAVRSVVLKRSDGLRFWRSNPVAELFAEAGRD
jgi:hypothetical protein